MAFLGLLTIFDEPLQNFWRWYSVISKFLTRPRVAQRLVPWMTPCWPPIPKELFDAMIALLFPYGHSKSAGIAISPLFSLLRRSLIIVLKPLRATGVSLVNGGTGGCFLWIVAYNWCSIRFWRFSIVHDLGISPYPTGAWAGCSEKGSKENKSSMHFYFLNHFPFTLYQYNAIFPIIL